MEFLKKFNPPGEKFLVAAEALFYSGSAADHWLVEGRQTSRFSAVIFLHSPRSRASKSAAAITGGIDHPTPPLLPLSPFLCSEILCSRAPRQAPRGASFPGFRENAPLNLEVSTAL